MSLGDDYASLANSDMDQYFLSAPDKLAIIGTAAGIRITDRVVELGAGVGTVARTLTPCSRLTVIELDERLIPDLRRNVPNAEVINADGVGLLRTREVEADVIISNLPWQVTEELIEVLPQLSFRTAVLAVGSIDALDQLPPDISHQFLAVIEGDDFVPPQPVASYLLQAVRQPRNS